MSLESLTPYETSAVFGEPRHASIAEDLAERVQNAKNLVREVFMSAALTSLLVRELLPDFAASLSAQVGVDGQYISPAMHEASHEPFKASLALGLFVFGLVVARLETHTMSHAAISLPLPPNESEPTVVPRRQLISE